MHDDATQSTGDGGNEASQLAHTIVTNRKRKRKAIVSHVCGTSTSHKKKPTSMKAIGNRRQSAMESLHIWESIMDSSPMFNPLERRVLRFLALRCMLPRPIDTLDRFPIKEFHFPTLERFWNVVVSAIKISDFEFKDYLRPKYAQSLRIQLEDMVAMASFELNFGKTAQTHAMVSTLHECATKLVQMVHAPIAIARRTVTTTVTRMEVVEAMIPLQHASDPMATEFDDLKAIASIPQKMDQPEPTHELLADKFLLSLVEKEKKDHVGNIRWKLSIALQWNTWATKRFKDPMTHTTLKRRYKYLQNRLQRVSIATPTRLSSPPLLPQPMVPPSSPPPIPLSPPSRPSSPPPIHSSTAPRPSSPHQYTPQRHQDHCLPHQDHHLCHHYHHLLDQ